MKSNITTKCSQPPRRKFTYPPFLRLVLDFFLFCTATCTHSCLISLYFLPFLNPHKNRCVCLQIVANSLQNSPLFFLAGFKPGVKYGPRLYKIYRVFFASLPSRIRFLASLQTFSLTVRAHRLYQEPESETKTRKGDNG